MSVIGNVQMANQINDLQELLVAMPSGCQKAATACS
jgi:hypothetical protein